MWSVVKKVKTCNYRKNRALIFSITLCMLTGNNYFQGLFLRRKIGKLNLVYCFFQILGMATISSGVRIFLHETGFWLIIFCLCSTLVQRSPLTSGITVFSGYPHSYQCAQFLDIYHVKFSHGLWVPRKHPKWDKNRSFAFSLYEIIPNSMSSSIQKTIMKWGKLWLKKAKCPTSPLPSEHTALTRGLVCAQEPIEPPVAGSAFGLKLWSNPSLDLPQTLPWRFSW